ncbi:MAG TPA: dephospho-CoA kinase [Lapillicoccus sp.]|nr:dephospho-CoA kinase [Lapillicoccus sp.]
MLDVGLTGGIGSGKSTVARLFRDLGATVIDADVVAREVVEPGTPTLAAIADRFGSHLVGGDGALDRAGLAALVFPDPAALADLDRITGPAIAARVEQLRAAADPSAISVYDMPLLVERRLWPREHLTVVVGATEDTRVRRLVEQRGLDEADARHRIARQATDAQRRAAADVWVDNDGDVGATEARVRDVWWNRLVPFNANLLAGTRGRRPDRPSMVPPDPTWPAQADRLVARIADALGDRAPRIEHIGSTSVPGLAAKDVVDLQVGVPSLELADDAAFVADLAQRGFVRLDDITGDTPHPPGADPRRWAKRFHASMDPGRAANVHVREIGSPGWEFALQFRDWLRANPEDREQYASLKRALAAGASGTEDYAEAKEPWFADAYPRVVDWVRRTGWVDREHQPSSTDR